MLSLLTRIQPPTAPSPAKVTTIVATKHIPFVETLWLQLEAARSQVAAKREYLASARRLGLEIASVTTLTARTRRDETNAAAAAVELERIKRVLALGAEPTTPPDGWYCGRLVAPTPTKDQWGDDVYPTESWPSRYTGRRSGMVFAGAMPLTALERYAVAEPLLDDARVYSPHESDFAPLPEPVMRDPVLIGLIRFLGEAQYFELARWDIDGDLAVVFGRVGR